MSLEFTTIAIRSLMTADANLATLLGTGEAMRVYPVEAPDDAELPYVVYHQMTERLIGTKDAQVSNGWDFMVELHAQDPGAYITALRLARFTKNALNYKTSEVLDDDGEAFTLRMKFSGQEDITPEYAKDLIIIALAFRGTKIS